MGGASQRVRSRNVLTSEKEGGHPCGAAPGQLPGAGRVCVSLEDLILGGARSRVSTREPGGPHSWRSTLRSCQNHLEKETPVYWHLRFTQTKILTC